MGESSPGSGRQRRVSAVYRGRRAAVLENDALRLTVLEEGGHIAEIFDRRAGVNPLWTPPWPSIEPSMYDPATHPAFGGGPDAQLLAGIMGHSLCLDTFGAPSPEELAAGIPVHGEASVARYEIRESDGCLVAAARLPRAGLLFERRIELHGSAIHIKEAVENQSSTDRPIAWTQHVTLGPHFLERGTTQFRVSATRSKVFEGRFGDADYLVPAAEFEWPRAPRAGGGSADLQVFNGSARSGAYTAHLMDPRAEFASFIAFAPSFRLAFGYIWNQADFPWLGIWEENHSRPNPPWSGRCLARGMEFGVSPFPESRRAMIERSHMFGIPTYRWLPAQSRATVEYWALTLEAETIPESLEPPV
jgi:hypothetical protein